MIYFSLPLYDLEKVSRSNPETLDLVPTAFRSWNMRFDKVIKTYGFIKNGEEPYIYKWANGPVVVFLVLYVDDIPAL